jgi:hypothetical protein
MLDQYSYLLVHCGAFKQIFRLRALIRKLVNFSEAFGFVHYTNGFIVKRTDKRYLIIFAEPLVHLKLSLFIFNLNFLVIQNFDGCKLIVDRFLAVYAGGLPRLYFTYFCVYLLILCYFVIHLHQKRFINFDEVLYFSLYSQSIFRLFLVFTDQVLHL